MALNISHQAVEDVVKLVAIKTQQMEEQLQNADDNTYVKIIAEAAQIKAYLQKLLSYLVDD